MHETGKIPEFDSMVTKLARIPALSVVVIGKDEGERLRRCLDSVRRMLPPEGGLELIYVDSRSTDDSAEVARMAEARVVTLDTARPTAGAARNAGWRVAQAPIILFLDGDCTVDAEFAVRALPEFQDARVAVVFGRLQERFRETALYDRLVELDRTNPPPGPAVNCGGNAIMRRSVLETVNGFDPGLIGGEENDLCVHIRNLGLLVLRIDAPMAEHDLGMQRFSQYCVRAFRAGYGFAEVSRRHPGRVVWNKEKIGISTVFGVFLVLMLSSSAVCLIVWNSWIPLVATFGVAILQALCIAWRNRWKSSDRVARLLYGFFWVAKQLPALCGQVVFRLDRLAGHRRGWISYK